MPKARLTRHPAARLGILLFAMSMGFGGDGAWSSRPASAAGTVYYVSPSGSNANAGTLNAPWATVANGIKFLRPGDTLYLRGGTYVEDITSVTIRPGSATAPILVSNYPGERPVIQGLLWLQSPSWWTLDGVNVTWNPSNPPTRHMVKMTNGVGWTIKNSELWGARSFAALLVAGTVGGQPAGWTVSGNCVHDTYQSNGTNQDQLIYVNTGVTSGGGTIARNLLFNGTNGSGVKLGGSDVSGGAARVSVRANTIHNTTQSVLVAGLSHHNTIRGNILSKAEPGYANVRGYQLSGTDNTMYANLGYGAKSLLYNDPGYLGVLDGGQNRFPVDPQFDDTSRCGGFLPLNPEAAAYGRSDSSRGQTPVPPPTTATTIVTPTTVPTTAPTSVDPMCAVIEQRWAEATRQELESLYLSYDCGRL
jgi:hypothetical protein